MPITKSAKKSLRSSLAKKARNLKLRKGLEIALKKASASNFSSVVSTIDKAAKRQLLEKNKANRIKSRLAKKLKVTQASPRPNSGVKPAPATKPKKATGKAKPRTQVKKA